MQHKMTIITLLLTLLLTGCLTSGVDSSSANSSETNSSSNSISNTDSKQVHSQIVGSWLEQEKEDDEDSRKESILTFRSNGSFTSERFYKESPKVSAFYANGTYSINEDELKLIFTEGMEYSGGSWHEDGTDAEDPYPATFTVTHSFKDGEFIMEFDGRITKYTKTEERTRTN